MSYQKHVSKPFECYVCDHCFATQGALSQHHLVVHDFVDQYQENLNIKTEPIDVSETDSLPIKIESIRSVATTSTKPHKCQLCQESYDQSIELNNHLMVKHLQRKFECPDCEQDFKDFYDLGLHIRIKHNKEPTFTCHICDKKKRKVYTRGGRLISHYLQVHLPSFK